MVESIIHALANFESIDLAGLDAYRLQDRVDTKFLMSQRQLSTALGIMSDRYFVLKIEGNVLSRYRNLYFDTPDFLTYRQHHNGIRPRYKVRMREYVDSQIAFLEVKNKTNQERMVKSRYAIDAIAEKLDSEAQSFLSQHCPIDNHLLEPKLQNSFMRITLASRTDLERLTLDVGLRFEVEGIQVSLPDIAIAEVKQQRFSVHSPFFHQMRRQRIRQIGFSKYCAGIARMYPWVKQNQFKEQINIVNRLSGLRV